MNNKKSLSLLVLALLFGLSSPVITTFAENISPIESVEWGQESTSEAPAEEESQESSDESVEETSEETSEEATEDASTEESSEVESIVETEEVPMESALDTSSPLAFLEGVSQLEQRSVEYASFVVVGEEMDLISQNSLKDGDKYYTAQLRSPYLPSAIFSRCDRESIQEAHISVDDLIQYAADALNTQPQIYAGTVVEDFYVFTQENYDELQGKVVQLDSTEGGLNSANLEMFRVEDFLTEVAIEWLGHEEVINAFEANEMGEQVMIAGDIGVLYNEIAQAKQEEYPELSEFFDRATTAIEGTMNVDYENGVFGMGLVAMNDEEQMTGIELYLLESAGTIIDFTDEIVYSYEEFAEFVGFDVIQELNELEATLLPLFFCCLEHIWCECCF